jgi:hypothetical protein
MASSSICGIVPAGQLCDRRRGARFGEITQSLASGDMGNFRQSSG